MIPPERKRHPFARGRRLWSRLQTTDCDGHLCRLWPLFPPRIAPSGTAATRGSTTDPTMPAIDGTSSSSSEPSLSMLVAVYKMYA